MAKKLKVQLEVDSSKARSQVERDMSGIDIGGTSSSTGARSSGAADRLAKSLDTAAKKSGDFASSAEVMSAKARQVVGAFTGMGVSMAMSFASQNMKKGGARDAVEIGAGTLQGAAMGGMAGGPWGALGGAALGLGMGIWNKTQEKKRYTEDWEKSEHDYASNKEFSDLLKSLTDVSDKTDDFAAKIKSVEEELEKYKQVEGKLKENVAGMIKSGRYDDADAQRSYLAENRSRQEQLEQAKKQLESAAKKTEEKSLEAASMSGTDALQKIGAQYGTPPPIDPATKATATKSSRISAITGFSVSSTATEVKNFGSGFSGLESSFERSIKIATERTEQLEIETNKILREIAMNTKTKGGLTWQ
jgi:hypothetical protein